MSTETTLSLRELILNPPSLSDLNPVREFTPSVESSSFTAEIVTKRIKELKLSSDSFLSIVQQYTMCRYETAHKQQCKELFQYLSTCSEDTWNDIIAFAYFVLTGMSLEHFSKMRVLLKQQLHQDRFETDLISLLELE